jgi:hypothetical protein
LSWPAVGWVGAPAEVVVLQAVEVAPESDDVGVVDESVHHGGGSDVVQANPGEASRTNAAPPDRAERWNQIVGGSETRSAAGRRVRVIHRHVSPAGRWVAPALAATPECAHP